VPNEAARARILEVMTKRLRLSGDFNFLALARSTPGYVGAVIKSNPTFFITQNQS
jgi:ribosome biogenesis ATPase